MCTYADPMAVGVVFGAVDEGGDTGIVLMVVVSTDVVK
jgi:hypothetical protein